MFLENFPVLSLLNRELCGEHVSSDRVRHHFSLKEQIVETDADRARSRNPAGVRDAVTLQQSIKFGREFYGSGIGCAGLVRLGRAGNLIWNADWRNIGPAHSIRELSIMPEPSDLARVEESLKALEKFTFDCLIAIERNDRKLRNLENAVNEANTQLRRLRHKANLPSLWAIAQMALLILVLWRLW